MKKILFVDDQNLFEGHNPLAFLVEVPDGLTTQTLYGLERTQLGAHHIGGNWRTIMSDGQIEHKLLSQGRVSDYKSEDYDERYKVISGNY